MPIYTVEIDGAEYDIEGERPPTEAEARGAIGTTSAPKSSMLSPAQAERRTPGVVAPGPKPTTMTDEAWTQLSAGDKIRNVLQWSGKAIAGMTGMNDSGREAVDNPKTTLALAAVPAVVKKIPGIVSTAKEAGSRVLGVSSARAAQNMEKAAVAAKGLPVNADAAGQAGLRAVELKAAGSTMPRAATAFMNRVTNPKAADLTFEEAQDFVSTLSRLSVNERNAMTKQMQRVVSEMSQTLRQAMVDTAETVGHGQTYQRGVDEFARSARAAERWDKVKPALMTSLRRLAGAAGLGGAAKVGFDVMN